jgi:hypothetical protein
MSSTTTPLKDLITGGIVYDEIISLGETWTVTEIFAAISAFQQQNLGSLSVDNLEDLKGFLFNLIEEIDGTIEMSQGRPATTRE